MSMLEYGCVYVCVCVCMCARARARARGRLTECSVRLNQPQAPMGPSLPFAFVAPQGEGATAELAQFTPYAGRWYDATGEVSPD